MSRTISIRFLLAAIVLVSTALPVTAASGAARASQKVTVYAVPKTAQFMNHADDRLRGMSTNPFKLKAEAVIINANGKEKGNGPFPGDDILYAFKLFADAKLTKPIGTAIFTCYYGFEKRATCDSYFDLARGLVLASGQVPYGSSRFALGVTGGTRSYFGALGQVNVVAAVGNAQRFDIPCPGRRNEIRTPGSAGPSLSGRRRSCLPVAVARSISRPGRRPCRCASRATRRSYAPRSRGLMHNGAVRYRAIMLSGTRIAFPTCTRLLALALLPR